MAQFELIMFAINVEVRWIDDACAGRPGNYFFRLSPADLEIVIEEPSWVHWYSFPAFAQILDCEIREFDFLARPVFHTRSLGSFLFGSSMSATDRNWESENAADQEN
jgi:hypothetical protein